MDDRTVGLVLRALRRRRGWRQVDLAVTSGLSQSVISALERGHLAGVTIDTIRRAFGGVDARLVLKARWRGAEVDRLLDADHASLVETAARRLEAAGWQPIVEVTYAMGFERGSIDVLGIDPARRSACVIEVKSDIPGAEGVGRKLDEKGRLAPSIIRDRFGWTPTTVGLVLVLPDVDRLRRMLAGPAAILARMFPVGSRRVEGWLREPAGPLRGTWFVSNIAQGNVRARRRIRVPPSGVRLPAGGARRSVARAAEAADRTMLR